MTKRIKSAHRVVILYRTKKTEVRDALIHHRSKGNHRPKDAPTITASLSTTCLHYRLSRSRAWSKHVPRGAPIVLCTKILTAAGAATAAAAAELRLTRFIPYSKSLLALRVVTKIAAGAGAAPAATGAIITGIEDHRARFLR